MQPGGPADKGPSLLDRVIRFSLENRLVVLILLLAIILWGVMVAPFDWHTSSLPRDPVPVDAIPDIGENQQIVFTKWMGRSPRDIEDQVTYPLTVSLLGIPGVKTIRSYSYFGFSTIYVIFKDGVEFYWSRSRVLEKLASLPPDAMPDGASPTLGPDATAIGQVFWYTLEGYGSDGEPSGGWDLEELRSIQDWTVRYALMSAGGVSEVASIGGFVREYQVDVDPDAMFAYGIGLGQVYDAVRMSNIDTGARTIEINRVEYVIRGLGFIKDEGDLENTVILERGGVPVRVGDIASVTIGPAARRGALDKGGAEAVGGVVVVRYGENPLEAIKNVKKKIAEISPGLPKKTLPDGTVSQVRIVPFYDRTGLIYETLGTLNTALIDEILVTIIVVLVMVMNLRAALLISGLLPLTVLTVFIAMKTFGVDANIVALSGIAIAIGTIVDMGIVITENILRHLAAAGPEESRLEVIYAAASEVGSAVVTAIATTVVSFLPVFMMTAAEGKLFKPLAYTKTFALVASVIIALVMIPPAAHMILGGREKRERRPRYYLAAGLVAVAVLLAAAGLKLTAAAVAAVAAWVALSHLLSVELKARISRHAIHIVVATVAVLVAAHWRPLGYGRHYMLNLLFVAGLLGGFLLLFRLFYWSYEPALRWCLSHRKTFLSFVAAVVLLGGFVWKGFDFFAGFMPRPVRSSRPYIAMSHTFPGLGKEFMPSLDEGSFLYMPTTMPHASIGEALDVLRKQDMAFTAIPEIESVVGKIGRADTPLDPAPLSMIETVINYKPEYVVDASGHVMRFRYDKSKKVFARGDDGNLIPDSRGKPFRNWRDEIKTPGDIWDEIVKAGAITGTTSAPKLQPIETRIVMLQSGMRAPMGIKVRGPDLETIESVGLEIERLLKQVPQVEPAAVFADRIVGKPYLEIAIDRDRIARYGLHMRAVQDVIEVAIGGVNVTTTVEGRERYPVRVRYPRELRGDIDDIGRVLVPAPGGAQVPLSELAEIRFVRGPMVIKSEDTFLTGYVIFDGRPGYGEVEVVEAARSFLHSKVESGELEIPAGVSYAFAGSWENQVRSERKLAVVLPIALLAIFLILYMQFRRVSTTVLVFSGIFLAWSGGFIMLWLYGTGWFLDFSLFGVNMRDLFNIRPYNLSVAVWVGFLALFGIASDDGVLMSTYLQQTFRAKRPGSAAEIRDAVVTGAMRRVRPALMTSATTILALIPVLTSTGKGSGIMVPMAIPSFGGMTVVMITVFLVPVLYSIVEERRLKRPRDS